jgi:hypothetical protein
VLSGLLDVSKSQKGGDIKKLEGTNYGCPYSGYYDSPFQVIQRLLGKYQSIEQSKASTAA